MNTKLMKKLSDMFPNHWLAFGVSPKDEGGCRELLEVKVTKSNLLPTDVDDCGSGQGDKPAVDPLKLKKPGKQQRLKYNSLDNYIG